MKKCRTGDAGFSLIEVIVSLAILALLMLPALGSFLSAARVNRQTGSYQKAAVLGQNLMEAVMNKDISQTALMFNGAGSFRLINSNLTGDTDTYRMKSYPDCGYGEYALDSGTYQRVLCGDEKSSVKLAGSPPVSIFSPPTGRTTYLFGISNIEDSGSHYDVLITLDSAAYRDTVKYPGSCNNYRMPDLTELNLSEAALLDSCDSTDNQALEEFYQCYLSYLNSLDEEPVPAVSEENMKNAVSKHLLISIKKDGLNQSIQTVCKAVYNCSLDLNGDGSDEKLQYDLYTESCKASANKDYDRVICLFYKPSVFPEKDTITVTNDGADIKLIIAKQERALDKETAIRKTELNSAGTEVYTNLSSGEVDAASLPNITEHTLISRKEASDRIYDIKVAVYKSGTLASGNRTEPYVTLHSAKK